ncbi:MAG: DUF930 domain-containing protein [Devosia sp.]
MRAMGGDGRLMVAMRQTDRLVFTRGVSVSVLTHAIVLVLLALVAVPHALQAPLERVMAVDIVSPDQLATLQRPRPAVPQPVPPPILATAAPERLQPRVPDVASAPALAPANPTKGQKVKASRFYASGILSDPANADLRRNFKTLATSEQLVQLCNIEAVEQLGRDGVGQPGPAPDVVVGYAFGDLAVSGTTLVADGGAYRQGGAWYRLRFECTSNADMSVIAAFSYTLGDSVPKSAWEEHSLNVDDEGLD